MKTRILSIAEAAGILNVGYPDIRDMVARRELPALVVVAGDALIAEAALREFIAASWHREPWEGLA